MLKETLDFVAFDDDFLAGFTAFLTAESVPFEVSRHSHVGVDDGLLVSIPEALDEALLDRIEETYDGFLDRFAAQDELAEGDDIHRVGIQFSHEDGEVSQIRLPPDLVNRLTHSISYPELQAVVQEIATQVERREDKRLCEK